MYVDIVHTCIFVLELGSKSRPNPRNRTCFPIWHSNSISPVHILHTYLSPRCGRLTYDQAPHHLTSPHWHVILATFADCHVWPTLGSARPLPKPNLSQKRNKTPNPKLSGALCILRQCQKNSRTIVRFLSSLFPIFGLQANQMRGFH